MEEQLLKLISHPLVQGKRGVGKDYDCFYCKTCDSLEPTTLFCCEEEHGAPRYIVVPISIGIEKIMGLECVCDPSSVIETLQRAIKQIQAETMKMQLRADHPKDERTI